MDKRIDRLFRYLKKNLPIKMPVYYRIRPLKKYHGITYNNEDHYLIIIDKNQNFYQKIETVLHEMAHTLQRVNEKEEHGKSWGEAYGRVYRAWEQFNKELDDKW